MYDGTDFGYLKFLVNSVRYQLKKIAIVEVIIVIL